MQEDNTGKTALSLYEPNPVLRAGMYGLAVVAGVATASFKVWDRFYTKIKHTDLISGLSQARYDKLNAVYDSAKTNPLSYGEYKQQVATIEKEYSREVNQVLKKSVGIESEGFGAVKGTLQRFEVLGPFTRTNIAFAGLVTIGTTVGAYFLINKNRRLQHELETLHARLDDVSPQQQR